MRLTPHPPGPDTPCSTRAFAHLVTWEGPYEVTGPHSITTWEPIATSAPADARPHTCYLNKVQFIRPGGKHDEFPLAEHRDLNFTFPALILVGGNGHSRWYELSCGQVVHRNDGWWMERKAFANTRTARFLNHGWLEEWNR